MRDNLRIVGVREKDEKFILMRNIYNNCVAAQIDIPHEVEMFFDGEEPSEYGVRVDLDKKGSFVPVTTDGKDGYCLDLYLLPSQITLLEFYNSY